MRAHELQGILIDDGRHIGMQPQNSRRDLWHDPAAQQALCDLRLSAAAEEQQDALCLHQHTETDRNSLPGHGVRVVKVVSIRGKRLRGKVHKVRQLRKIICRLVEADVAGVADAEDLQIGRVGAAECFIAAALGLRVGCIALRDRRMLRRDAAGTEEMLLQIGILTPYYGVSIKCIT